MKNITFLLAILMALSSIEAGAVTKKKSKKKLKKSTLVAPKNAIAIAYPGVETAFHAIKARKDVVVKTNAKPFGWQERSGPWYVANENAALGKQESFEWAFTQPGHYAHPSVVKRMIDVGSKDHVYVDMAFRCGAPNMLDCDKLLTEFKEVKLLINKVYQKKFIQTADGTAAWDGPSSLE